ncbi:MAG TPA: four helix bundle protein [Chthoniobacteraceae bacterium]|nr:four helix bundle protein [Chthoniobacteraceae bacterium]
MDIAELQKTTVAIGLRVIRVCESLPDDWHARALGRELLRCGTTIGAHFRAVARAKTPSSMSARIEHVEEAADDTLYWLDLISLAGIVPASRLRSLVAELEKLEQQLESIIASLRRRRAAPRIKAAAA